MPRKKRNARRVKRRGKRVVLHKAPRLCYIVDDGIRPGKIVAAAEYAEVSRV